MKVAVIGAGFAGLAVSLALLHKGISVTLYDQKVIGGGASGIASGLLHPYIGEGGKRSEKATEALVDARALIEFSQTFSTEKVADFSGLVRQVPLDLQEIFVSHEKRYGDVERLSKDFFLIRSGIVVHSSLYLQGLYQGCLSKGMEFQVRKISFLEELEGYDLCVFAVGAGVFSFAGLESLQLKPVRGQILLCEWPSSLPVLTNSLV